MSFVVTTAVLASAVADDGTVDIAYPSGTNQAYFTGDNASATGVVVVNDNEVYQEDDPGVAILYDTSVITITNQSGVSWAVGATLRIQLGRAGNDRPGFQPAPAIADLGTLDVTATVNQTTVNTQLNAISDKVDAVLRALRGEGIISS